MKYIIFFLMFVYSSVVFSASQVGLIVMAKGDVKILSTKVKSGPSLSFEGKRYVYRRAKMAAKVYAGEIVLSGTNGKSKIIYTNGDQFFVGPSSMVSMPVINKKTKASSMDLIYGKVRAVIHPKKELNRLKVKTKSAVSGVRGTDFVSVYHDNVGAFTTVVRGKVELESKKTKKKIIVQTGKTAKLVKRQKKTIKQVKVLNPKDDNTDKIATVLPKKAEHKVVQEVVAEVEEFDVQDTSKQEVTDIKESFQTLKKEEVAKLEPKIQKEIVALEKQAKENVIYEVAKLENVKATNLAKQTLEEINNVALKKIAKLAPSRKLEWEPKSVTKIEREMATSFYEPDGFDFLRFGLATMNANPSNGDSAQSLEVAYMPRFKFRYLYFSLYLGASFLDNYGVAKRDFDLFESSGELGFQYSSFRPFLRFGNKRYKDVDSSVSTKYTLRGAGVYKKLLWGWLDEGFIKFNTLEFNGRTIDREYLIGITL